MFVSDYDAFAKIPILDQGRIKPLDTFARSYLERFLGKDSLHEMEAIEWLAEVLFQPEQSYQRLIFNIPNPAVVTALQLERRQKHHYSFQELSTAAMRNFNTLHPLFMKPHEELSLPQQQLLNLYSKMRIFADLSRSFDREQNSQTLRIIPGQWGGSSELWFSPAGIGVQGQGSPRSAVFLKMWEELAEAYRLADNTKWNDAAGKIRAFSLQMAGKAVSGGRLSLEVSFNRWKLFSKSLMCYLLAFLIVMAGFMVWPRKMRQSAFGLLGWDFFFMSQGLVSGW